MSAAPASETEPPGDGLTERQRRAAHAPGSVAIVAGAGTGKTHTLGHRYLTHLREGASPLAVVAITFTERASHELRARVRRYARDAFGAHDRRMAELEAAPIGTVHALCLRICRDHPRAAGVPPDVRILDPLEGDLWWSEQLDDALASVPEPLFDALPYDRVRDALASLLRDPYEAERAFARPTVDWEARAGDARRASRARHLAGADLAEALRTLRALPLRPEGDAGERARRNVLAASDAAHADDVEAAAAALHGVRATVGSERMWGSDRDALRGALKIALDALRDWRADPRSHWRVGPADRALAELLPLLHDAWRGARHRMAAAKRRAGVVDFADVEVAAVRALDDRSVQAHYRARWAALLVDEAQDTSPVQEALIARLAAFCRTTVVGDPKQSIYGFRGADAAVFQRLTDAVDASGGETVALDLGFRTHAPLVATSNRAFEELMGELHAPLRAHAPQAPSPEPSLRWWRTDLLASAPAPLVRLAEAHRIADELAQALRSSVPVRDPGVPAGVRPIRPGDVAVLSRGWAALDLLAEVLPARGVPAVHTGGGNLLTTREARDGIAALRFLADPHDDVALAALLRGPMFAVGDDDLDRFATAVPGRDAARGSWWDRLRETRPEWAERALCTLEASLRAARDDPPARLLQRLDRATGWSAVAANLPGGDRRAADRTGFVAWIRELQRGGGDVASVARRLRRLLAAEVQVDRPSLEAGDAVTLTTVHKSKGLEWPWVVVAALDARGRNDAPAVRFGPEVGVAVQVEAPDDPKAIPLAWAWAEDAAKRAREAEDRRLLYVAATRAADATVASSVGDGGPLASLLVPALERAGVQPEVVEVNPDAIAWPEPASVSSES
ncbi:MAG: UvrD-helicase domain-containing protein [Trueperaceae bacterium]